MKEHEHDPYDVAKFEHSYDVKKARQARKKAKALHKAKNPEAKKAGEHAKKLTKDTIENHRYFRK